MMTYDVGATQNYKAVRLHMRFLFKAPTQIDTSAPLCILFLLGYLTQAFFIHVMIKIAEV